MEIRTVDRHVCSMMLHNLEACILGKREQIERLLIAVIAGGHVLIEDVPGTGKTQLVKALAKTIGGQFRRVQCNPDLLPTDITGVSIYHPRHEQFQFRPGPIMTNILLADEINRATTKTQSALLEAMEEAHVTVDGETYHLPQPFVLLATQNPIEFEGTYSLPEAQLDRFMMRLTLGYPSKEDEHQMIVASSKAPSEHIQAVIDIEDMLYIQEQAQQIHIDSAVATYILSIISATREHENVVLGASPRATIALAKAARARAFLHERDYVTPDDVKELAPYVIAHRLLLQMEAKMRGINAQRVVDDILQSTKVPVRLEN
ncbi:MULTISPECIES: AAA family ATPase [unclassified Paenibacillus]|uniref:AAA family ATPase n=1 Tax=unclassified Paenibacillus TaxID=185978 RepID=UPI002F42E07F